MDCREQRLQELLKQLAEPTAQVRATAVGSLEQDVLLIPMEPLLNNVLALAEEVELPARPQSHGSDPSA